MLAGNSALRHLTPSRSINLLAAAAKEGSVSRRLSTPHPGQIHLLATAGKEVSVGRPLSTQAHTGQINLLATPAKECGVTRQLSTQSIHPTPAGFTYWL